MSKYIKFFNMPMWLLHNVFKGVIIVVLIAFLPSEIYSQRFSANGILGVTAAQINGDDLAGYNKLGLTGGIRTDYFFKPNISLGVELLYSQRGSQSSLTLGTPAEIQKINLNYIEIPVMFVIHDWYIEDPGFYKVKAETGFSYGNLFSSSSTNSFYDDDVELFSKNDLSFLLGATFRINQKIGLTTRYTRSFTSLYSSELLPNDLLGYFLTFRFEYFLL